MARTKKRKTAKRTTTRKSTARKTTKRKPAARKAAGRKKAAKKAAPRKKAAKKTVKKTVKLQTTAIKSALNKSQILTYISESTELSKKEVSTVFETLGNLMHRHLRKGGAGEFTVPSLMKCVVKRKPATKARKGINPFTGEEIMFKAKPARNVIKVRPLKKLKEMAE
ncbi:MAG: HU family DNA-binding protein [Gammaproteobacteria bacterium]|nr:HU family DNA-binding protein [Gammaproteobacteria bacterium]MCH9744374.1 HU family DNA-binding protein [Gammaproteobacteria bacterium]